VEPQPAVEPSTRKSPDECLRCGAQLQSAGIEEFRVGGTSGGWKLLFGEWAELGEGMLKMEVRYCQACGQVDLRLPPR
jgi:hypothetical protein